MAVLWSPAAQLDYGEELVMPLAKILSEVAGIVGLHLGLSLYDILISCAALIAAVFATVNVKLPTTKESAIVARLKR